MMPEYVYHHIRQGNGGYPYLFTVRPTERMWRADGERERIVAEVMSFVLETFGPIGTERWRYSAASDIFKFASERDAFIFRMRWA